MDLTWGTVFLVVGKQMALFHPCNSVAWWCWLCPPVSYLFQFLVMHWHNETQQFEGTFVSNPSLEFLTYSFQPEVTICTSFLCNLSFISWSTRMFSSIVLQIKINCITCTWSMCVPTINMGASGAWLCIELSQKSSPACSYPCLVVHSRTYTALSDKKNWNRITSGHWSIVFIFVMIVICPYSNNHHY